MYCPDDIIGTIELGDSHKTIVWLEPRVTDNSGHVSLLYQSHSSGDSFQVDDTEVRYDFADLDGNKASCTFYVTLKLGKLNFHIAHRN